MFNELLLFGHILFLSFAAGLCLRLGKEALVAYTVIAIMLANVFVIKQTMLFSFAATSADALAIGSLLGFNLLQEFYSKRLAQKTIFTTFVLLAMYAVLTRFHLLYEPSSIDITHDAFVQLFSMAPWLIGGSIAIWSLSLSVDYLIFGLLQQLWPERLLIVRNYIAIGASQAIDTFLHTRYLLWLGVISNVWQVFAISFLIKFVITLIATPLVTLMAWKHPRSTNG